jgi:membrane-bound lytic murein transglycosylase A
LNALRLFAGVLVLALAACTTQPGKPAADAPAAASVKACQCGPVETLPPLQIPDAPRYQTPPAPTKAAEPGKKKQYEQLRPAEWSALTAFEQDDVAAAWPALRQSCGVLKKQAPWSAACTAVLQVSAPSAEAARALLRQYFMPYYVINPDGSNSGLVTGYYEPLLNGSRSPGERFRYPLYSRPEDLVTVELGEIYPELAYRRLRGKIRHYQRLQHHSR